jgi:N,N-dimethylformamidase
LCEKLIRVERSGDQLVSAVEACVSFDPPGVYAYAANSIAAGETVHFHVSSDRDYQLSIYRLGADPDSSASDVELQRFPPSPARIQSIHPGSYVHVAKALPASQALGAFSAECWVRPWRTDRWQGLVTQHRFPDACGFGLFLANGVVHAYLGDGGPFQEAALHAGPPIPARRWSHVVVTWDGREASLHVNGECSRRWAFTGPLVPGPSPLRLGAYGFVDVDGRPKTAQFLDGDLAMPVLYDRALDAAEIHRRFSALPPTVPVTPGVLACWPLAEERGSTVGDVSRHARSGDIVNHASWMIGGPGYNAAGVPRYGSYDPRQDSTRGHGLRFASDDLYDCAWSVTQSFTLPADTTPGLHVGRIRVNGSVVYEVPFVVRRSADRPRAQILVLCATSTWLAYSAAFAGTGPAFSCYTTHEAGQPTFQLGLHMPMEAAGVYALYSDASVGYSHLVRAERFLHVWLERNGYAYDLVTDLDLHRDPALLDGYQVLMINGHSEYWSVPAWRAVDDFLTAGGCVAVLSGNTVFWRVSFDASGTVMECRKYDGGQDFGGQLETVGELWHSHDFQRGGLLREAGYPCWKLLGLETAGMADTSDSDFIPFTVEDSDHFLFHTPHATGAVNGHAIGQAAGGGLPRAVGHEWDARVIRLLKEAAPVDAVEPTEPTGITTLATARKTTGLIDYYGRRQSGPPTIISEIAYWERPQGGRVFYAGTIGAGWVLSVDTVLHRMMQNVLHHFGVAGTG